MALLAEELVEEWLNRQGYFTIRGIKLGVHEVDLFAIRPSPNGLECRQFEVQASFRPVSYITKVPRDLQRRSGRAPGSARKRNDEELRQGIREWINKKFDHPSKNRLRRKLAVGSWSRELVVHVVKHEREVELIQETGIVVHCLTDIVANLKKGGLALDGAAGADLVDLVAIAAIPRATKPNMCIQRSAYRRR